MSKGKFTAEFKAKVAIEALKEQENIEDLAKRFNIKVNDIKKWKKEFYDNAAIVFTELAIPGKNIQDREKRKLYEVIGQQKVAIDFLMKVIS